LSSITNSTPPQYYSRHGRMTDPREEARMFADLPRDVPALRDVVQGLLVHVFWAQRSGLTLSADREQELQIRSVSEKLKRIRKLTDRPLTEPRPLERRLVGNCRDFSLMLCAMLRHQGVPARARCGFAKYFEPNHFEDHWVCECWQGAERWVMVDAQLDALQREKLGISFDPLDVPDDQFLTGGKAWGMCRTGKANPDAFGIFDMHGLWFVRGNLIRDLASLNKMELLPWDSWGLIDRDEKELSKLDLALLDEVAAITQVDNSRFEEIRSIYQNNECLRVPPVIRSYLKTGVQTVEIKT
jgi:hypothetical protein